jgi:hypothetical protein
VSGHDISLFMQCGRRAHAAGQQRHFLSLHVGGGGLAFTNPQEYYSLSLTRSLSRSNWMVGAVCTCTRHARGQLGCARVWLVVLACVSFMFSIFFYFFLL